MYESSPRARSLGQRDSLSPRQHFLPKAVPTGRAAPDSQVCYPAEFHYPLQKLTERWSISCIARQGKGLCSLAALTHSQSTSLKTLHPAMQVYHQGTSQFKGVSWAERSKKWRAQLWFGSKVLRSSLSPNALQCS